LNEKEIEEMDEYYRARLRVIAGLDDMVGDLVKSLDNHGILDSTYVIYTTDNGYHIGQYRMGPGKKCGFDTDINIPLVMRGPGVPKNKNTNLVTTHTDLAPTFMNIFGLKEKESFDGKAMPISKDSFHKREKKSAYEHVNVEFWGTGTPSEYVKLHESANSEDPHDKPWRNSTYKSVRVLGEGYNLYYSVWCTNEHELYDMTADPWQVDNLLPDVTDLRMPSTSPPNKREKHLVNGYPVKKLADRLDALLMVLKSCKGKSCRHPWHTLHRQGNVHSLTDAMNPKYDEFYRTQVKIEFSACKQGYLIEFEGPQIPRPYGKGDKS
jgi:N-acetylglucosamine-6-sulfatase